MTGGEPRTDRPERAIPLPAIPGYLRRTMSDALRRIGVTALVAAAAVLAAPGTAAAAPTAGGSDPTVVGYDVSYPQCDTLLPPAPAFVVVGVNGGLATRANPCLVEQLEYAAGASGAIADQPGIQLYVNTANPGQVLGQVTTWPARGTSPYGACDGGNTMACSWLYGWERAQETVLTFFEPAARDAGVADQPAAYTWWLDVETTNTWQYGSDEARERNRAALEGMAAYLLWRGADVGLYSTGQQWGQIVGDTVGTGSNLAGRDSWLAGATTLSAAMVACSAPALVPRGEVALTQYVEDGLDHNHACR